MEMIVAVYDGWGIGSHGSQPLVLKADRKFFKDKTIGKIVIVGSRTVDTFPCGAPLPGRVNVVMTRKSSKRRYPGFLICTSADDAFRLDEISGNCIVIGGENIYQQFLPKCDRVYVTKINTAVKCDKFFPDVERAGWKRTKLGSGIENGISYDFFVYENINYKR